MNTTMIVAVCDPDPMALRQTCDLVGQAMSHLPEGCAVIRGYETPQALLAGPPCDLLLTEAELGSMDPMDLIAAVRARRPNAEAIIITKAADNDLAFRAQMAHVAQYLVKPIDISRLRRWLEMLYRLLPQPSDEGAPTPKGFM